MDRPDRDALDDATWEEAVAREAVIRKLLAGDRMERGDFYRACRDLGVKRSRLYELIRAYKAHPVTSSLVVQPAGMKNGSRRLPEETEAVIAEVINTFYKSRQKPNLTGLHKEIRRLCLLRNFHAPSWFAVRSRIEALDPAELAAAREGAKAVRDRYRAVPGQYSAERAFEVVQIDHTLVDVIVVDRQYRQPLQRPWLTLAIDVASRMVAGFYLTLEPPSVLTVSLAIQHLVLPKEDWLSGLDIKADWPAAGLPETIHIDNAKEFRSRALKRGAQEHGIALKHRPVAVPHYGGHIERRDTVTHNQGSYFALMADTMTRYKAGEPILYYTWLPLWVSSTLQPGKDVEWLNVPFTSLPDMAEGLDTSSADGRNSGFQINNIGVLANNKFLKDNPAAEKFFELASISIDDVNAAILRQHAGEDKIKQIRVHAEEWVAANQEVFDGWIKEAAAAAN